MTLIDADERLQATNPFSSYIVQAPAGSGKTEILTQRFLRLLGTIKAPEQIIALTFTRKAASEMRERIILALQQAASNHKAQSEHQQRTLEYARKALQRSEEFSWDLLQQSNRLKIMTIDALCQSINHAIPLLEKQISYAQICDKPSRHYKKAARACIHYALNQKEYQPAIQILLLHVDNKQERLMRLFTDLLAQRDQWLKPLFQARQQDKTHFEHALSLIANHEMQRFSQSLPLDLYAELLALCKTMAKIEANTQSPRFGLTTDFQTLSFEEKQRVIAQGLYAMLLTQKEELRKSFDHHIGLKKDACSKEIYKQVKEQSKELLACLENHPEFIDGLIQVAKLPSTQYDAEQWEVLQALLVLLPLLVGHLQLCFSEHNEVDFVAISQQALAALGEEENPTDLALYLDHSIQHLLVDEFQDTSITQFELIAKLVQGWQQEDGKTLFLVGDPMQSIYRFRQAEVGLFFRARAEGIGPVKLNALELKCNFRSQKGIVDWVNAQFATIFPKKVDIESGAVSFHPSSFIHQGDESSLVQAVAMQDRQEEAQTLISIIRHELTAYPKQTLAILVRSRNQLTDIITQLRAHQIPYQGTDIDLLANLPHIRDLWSLTQALLYPANRLSWLSALRSPYCGINLQDLHAIANFDCKQSIYSNLLQLNAIADLSTEGRTRAQYFINTMHHALKQRYHTHLSAWIKETLNALHVQSILTANEQEDLEQYLLLIDKYEQQGRLQDNQEFLQELANLYSQQVTPSRLQVMTIHKAKGLEFDTVLLPGLNNASKQSDNPLFRYMQIPTQKHGDLLLVSPIRGEHQEQCALYDYMKRIDAEKEAYERQRLLYVAVTRAKSRLYLLTNSTPAKGSFAALLKLAQSPDVPRSVPGNQLDPADVGTLQDVKIARLPLHFYQNHASKPVFINEMPAELKTSIPRLIGIVAHQLLQWICDHHPSDIEQIPWNLAQYELNKLGFDAINKQLAMEQIQEQIHNLFSSPIGQWIIQAHEQEQNEYELIVRHKEKLVTRIIDRTFVHQGQRWIIDFKTGNDDALSFSKHQQQLNEYAYYLYKHTPFPLQCGVYYLANGHWEHWSFELTGLMQ